MNFYHSKGNKNWIWIFVQFFQIIKKKKKDYNKVLNYSFV